MRQTSQMVVALKVLCPKEIPLNLAFSLNPSRVATDKPCISPGTRNEEWYCMAQHYELKMALTNHMTLTNLEAQKCFNFAQLVKYCSDLYKSNFNVLADIVNCC